jgi:predicted Zn-dependent protease
MSELTIQDWKVFLRARIEQEQGKDQQALQVFEALLQKYPGNSHLAASRAIGLQRLGRTDDAAAASIAAKYAALGRTLTGEQDKPEVWSAQLNSVLGEADDFQKSGKLAATLIAW